MYHSFLIHSLTDGHLGCFQHFIIVNNAAMNIVVNIFFILINYSSIFKTFLEIKNRKPKDDDIVVAICIWDFSPKFQNNLYILVYFTDKHKINSSIKDKKTDV